MRWISRTLGLLGLTAALCMPVRAEVHGLVIGIDDYAFVSSLAGAANDARDIAAAIERRGGQVTLLLDEDVTRARVLSAFSEIASRAQPGDMIVFSYAGHGVQLPEALPGDEVDGLDETYILHGFEPSGPGFDERIRDNDIAAMLAQVSPDVSVLMVADSCHSGTMTRAVDPRGSLGRSRFVDIGVPTTRGSLAKPDTGTRGVDLSQFPNVVFANAARDDQQTPEVRIDGTFRGALSWSVARALGGAADGGDGVTSLGDLRNFVVEQVRALSGARQTPGVIFAAETAVIRRLSALFDGRAASAPDPDPVTADLQLGETPEVFVQGEDGIDVAAVTDQMRLAEIEETAHLLWDRTRRELIDRATADVIAEPATEVDLINAVRKWRIVRPLIKWVPQRPLAFRVLPDDRRYRVGDQIHIEITRPDPGFSYVTIVNLASTGEVQFIYPAPGHVSADSDRLGAGEGSRRLGPAPVVPPVGSDHVLAIVSSERLTALHRDLDRLHGTIAPNALLRTLSHHAGDPTTARVGLLPLFTSR